MLIFYTNIGMTCETVLAVDLACFKPIVYCSVSVRIVSHYVS